MATACSEWQNLVPAAGRVAPLKWREARLAWERDYWTNICALCDGQVRLMAIMADVTRSSVYARMYRVGMQLNRTGGGHRGTWGDD
jgi:hypothetical protein